MCKLLIHMYIKCFFIFNIVDIDKDTFLSDITNFNLIKMKNVV